MQKVKGILVLILVVLFAVFVVKWTKFMGILFPDAPSTNVEYVLSDDTQLYIRDGRECIAYRVIIEDKVSEKELIEVFDVITDSDGYYLHTMWVYSNEEELRNQIWTVASLEEYDKFEDVTITYR